MTEEFPPVQSSWTSLQTTKKGERSNAIATTWAVRFTKKYSQCTINGYT